MKTIFPSACLALLLGMTGPLAAQGLLQYGFDATTGDVAVPVNDDSGAGHHGTNLLWGAAPTYSADIPTAGTAPGQARNVTGIGAVDFSSTSACISTANSGSVGSGQGIVTATQISNAGGLTMEVWVKNPSAGVANTNCFALNIGGYASLGINNGSLGFFGHTSTNVSGLRTNAFTAGEWNHLAAVLSGPNSTATSYSTISLYLNGELVNSVSNVNFHGFLTRAASVGNHQFGDFGNFNGLIYEPRVTLGALAPGQFTVVEAAGSLSAPELVEDSTNGQELALAVTVSNSSATAYSVTGISFTGAAAASFADDGNVFPLEIPANGSADVFVAFTPGASGLAEATLTLATDDPNAATLDVDFSIEVRDPEIVIASSLDFGLFVFVPGPTVRQLNVSNNGWNEDLVLSDPQITGAGAAAYSVGTLPGPITDFDVIEVTFTPTAAGSYPAVLTLTTNDPFNPTVTVNLGGILAGGGTPVLQWGFDATSGDVATPITDDSGPVVHDGTNLLHGPDAPVYSADIPAASMTQHVTGTGSVDFSGTSAGISTADSIGVGSGQGIITATEVFNAGGLTMEVWVKNPSSPVRTGSAINIGGMYHLGVLGGRIGFIPGDSLTIQTWTTAAYVPGEWNHLSVVMVTSDPAARNYSNISAYLNGVLIAAGSHTFPWFLSRATSVGNHQYGDWNNFDGLIYEPRISLGTQGFSGFTIKPGLRTLSALSGESDGADISLPVTITNSSGTAYQVTGVAYSGADAAAFSGTPTLPLVVSAGGSEQMSVDFTPTHGGGTYTATLTLTTNDPNNPTLVVTLTVVVAGANYQSWADLWVDGQAANLDFDNDGMPNGVEYFMGNTTAGFTANPPIGADRMVSWPKGADYTGAYGTDYRLETSTDLGSWTPVPQGDVTIDADSVDYTLPLDGPSKFVRLVVTGP